MNAIRTNRKGSRKSRDYSVEKHLATVAEQSVQANASAVRLGAVVCGLVAVALMFYGLVTIGGVVAVAAAACVACAGLLGNKTSRLRQQFAEEFGNARALDQGDEGKQKMAKSYLAAELSELKSRSRSLSKKVEHASVILVVAALMFAGSYYQANTVKSPAMAMVPSTLVHWMPALQNPEEAPNVIANAPGQVSLTTQAVQELPGLQKEMQNNVSQMIGGHTSGNQTQVNEAADLFEQQANRADEILSNIQHSAAPPAVREQAKAMQKQLGQIKQSVNQGRKNPQQAQQAQDSLKKFLEALQKFLKAAAEFLKELIEFIDAINQSGSNGQGTSPNASQQGSNNLAQAASGQQPSQSAAQQHANSLNGMQFVFTSPSFDMTGGSNQTVDPNVQILAQDPEDAVTTVKRKPDSTKEETDEKQSTGSDASGVVAPAK